MKDNKIQNILDSLDSIAEKIDAIQMLVIDISEEDDDIKDDIINELYGVDQFVKAIYRDVNESTNNGEQC